MTRNENQMYSDVSSIAKSLEKIAKALDNNATQTTKDIPGFEGTLDALDVLTDIKTITDDYASKHPVDKLDDLYQPDMSVYGNKDEEVDDTPTSDNPDPAGYGGGGFDGLVEYETDLQEIRVDSDHDIRSTAAHYEETVLANGGTKKECILDYVTNEFGALGARYTDIIKFAYYLGEHNGLKYTSADRGYYSCAFATRFGGHLIQGGKDFLVKGINKEGKERYFAHSNVNSFTDYYKRIA